MGIPIIFDKSFLQSLSINESVWFDRFFISNICPLFYVETLADLGKTNDGKRSPEREVKIIADKFPECNGSPSANYKDMVINSLLGNQVPMTGQIPIAGGRPVRSGNRAGVVFQASPESIAFMRWQNREFDSVEREFAREWRNYLSSLNLQSMNRILDSLDVEISKCRSLYTAKKLASRIVEENQKPLEIIRLAILFFGITGRLKQEIVRRLVTSNYPSLVEHAPYAGYVLTVELFFQIAIASSLISPERKSNRIDIAYLYYLPFCTLFVSYDKLHKRTSLPFLRKDQEFIWGPDLKEDLHKLNEYYKQLPEAQKIKGVHSFAPSPPHIDGYLVTRLWDKYLPGWRDTGTKRENDGQEDNRELLEQLKEFSKASSLKSSEIDFDPSDPDNIAIERKVSRRKGDWYQIGTHISDES